jgi:hypothetical protein
MSNYIKVEGDPDDVIGIGARLKSQAASFGAQAQGILHEITSIDGGAPWGQDETGHEFQKSYNQVPEGGDTPFSDAVKTELSKAGEQLDKVGDGIMLAMTSYQSVDTTSEHDIRKL